MPFIGTLNDTTIIPEDVDDGVTVRCPECDGKMTSRGPFDDGRARHFYHTSATDGNCSGGESDPHRKMKSIAVSTLKQHFPDHSRCEPEYTLDISQTETLPDTRRADAIVELSESNLFYGGGIIIEIQYRNHGKDLFATTHDYLSLGYSVYWATPSDFDNNRLDFDRISERFSQQDDDAYAHYHYDPGEFSTELAASLDWEYPDLNCDHDWHEITDTTPEYESCGKCETNRIYDTDRTRYLYDTAELLGPTTDLPGPEITHSCAQDDGHVWEPYGNGVYRCGVCSSRQVELTTEWGESRELILDETYMGKDLTELTANPDACSHDWESHRSNHKCTRCGLIDPMLY